MTEQEQILKKLDEQTIRLEKIELAISTIAVQDEKILNLQSQVSQLWKKYDSVFGPDGVIPMIRNFQASCPRETIKKDLSKQWAIIGILALVVTGALLKAFGVA